MQKLGQLKGFKTPARSHTISRSALPVFAEPPLPLSHRSSCPRSLSPARPHPHPHHHHYHGVRGQLPSLFLPRQPCPIFVLSYRLTSPSHVARRSPPAARSPRTSASMYLSARFPPASSVLRRLPLSCRLVCLPPLGCFFSGSPDLFPRRPSSSIDSQS